MASLKKMFLLLAVLLLPLQASAYTIDNPDTPWLITCDDGRLVRQTPFTAGMTPAQLCGEVDIPVFPSDPTTAYGATDDFVMLFGKYPGPDKPNNGTSLDRRAEQQRWKDKLAAFIGVVTPQMIAEPGGPVDYSIVENAREAGELDRFTASNATRLQEVSTAYQAGLPIFYLEWGQRIWPGDGSKGPVLRVRFINQPVERDTRAYGPLKYPWHAVSITQVKQTLKGHCVANPIAMFPPALSEERVEACK